MGLLSKSNNANTGYDNNTSSQYPSDNTNNTTTGISQTGFRDEGLGHTNNDTTQGPYAPGQPQERIGGAHDGHLHDNAHHNAGGTGPGYGTNTNPNTNNTNDPTYGAAGPGIGAPGTGMGFTADGMGAKTENRSDLPPGAIPGELWVEYKQGQHLERNGKMEKMLGTVLMSSGLKEKGLAKQQEGAALIREVQHDHGVTQGEGAMHHAHGDGRAGVTGGAGTSPGEYQHPSHVTAGRPSDGGSRDVV